MGGLYLCDGTKIQNMDEKKFHKELLHKKIIVLDISDDYQYMDENLIEILKQSMKNHLD